MVRGSEFRFRLLFDKSSSPIYMHCLLSCSNTEFKCNFIFVPMKYLYFSCCYVSLFCQVKFRTPQSGSTVLCPFLKLVKYSSTFLIHILIKCKSSLLSSSSFWACYTIWSNHDINNLLDSLIFQHKNFIGAACCGG